MILSLFVASMICTEITTDLVADAKLDSVNSTLYERSTLPMKLCVPLFTPPVETKFSLPFFSLLLPLINKEQDIHSGYHQDTHSGYHLVPFVLGFSTGPLRPIP